MHPAASTPPAAHPPPPVAPPVAAAPRRPRAWTVALCLAAIFGCGVLVGVLGTFHALRHQVRHRLNPDRWSGQVMGTLDRRLALSPEQHAAIAPLVRAGAEEARAARGQAFQETLRIVERTHGQVADLLSPEQRQRLDEFLAQRRGRARRWLGPEDGGGGRRPSPPGPPRPATTP